MRRTGTFLRVGVLMLVGTAALLGLVLFLSGQRLSEGIPFESYFRESVQGLEVGAPVKYRGVTIGRVTNIGLVSAEYGRNEPLEIQRSTYQLVFVRYTINPDRVGRVPDTETAIRTGLRARLASQGITGISYIELDFADPKEYPPLTVPWKPRAEVIPSMPSTLTQVQDAAQQFLAKLNQFDIGALSQSITGLLDELRTELATGDAHIALTHATELLTTLRQTVDAAELPKLTQDLRNTSGSLRQLVQGKEIRTLMANLTEAADHLSVAAAKLPPLLAGLEATTRRAGSSTADIQQSLVPLLRDMQAAAANLRDTTEALRRYPAQVLLGGPPPRERNQ
jgi:ABC-type transporter Mla subunit MlaD